MEKIDPSTLAFDIDGVVADTMTLFLDIAGKDYGITGIKREDISDYDLRKCLDIDESVLWKILTRIVTGKYRFTLRPHDGAISVISRLVMNSPPVLFVTARPLGGHITKWLRSNLGIEDNGIEVVATGSFEDKAEVLKSKNIRYFVEDRLETCYHLAKEGIEPIVFVQPWNRRPHPFREVRDWTELSGMIAMP